MSLFRTSFTPQSDFGSLFRLLDDYDSHCSTRKPKTTLSSFSPRFDVRESEDAYLLDGELPGLSQKQIDIEFSDPHTLVVKGHIEREYHTDPEAKDESENAADDEKTPTASHRFWASERSIGKFERSFSFPGRVDQDAVKANLKNGVLSVVIPKATATATKKITVE